MKHKLMSDITHYMDGVLNGALKVNHCPDKYNNIIEKLDIRLDLKRLLQWNWLNEYYDGHHRFNSVAEIIDSDNFKRFFDNKFIQIGTCINGDMIEVDYSDEKCPVYFISHDELWENDNDKPRDCAVLVTETIEEFMLRVAEFKYLPTGSYTGTEYRELLNLINKRS